MCFSQRGDLRELLRTIQDGGGYAVVELRLENVTYRYRNADRAAVDTVSCSFRGGEVCAVVGPSGSGKTTLLSLMAGLDEPSSGRIVMDGEDLASMDLDRYRREKVAMIFQAFHLFPLLTVLENVCFPMELSGIPEKDVEVHAKDLLWAVGIEDEKYGRFPANLSGGEQQRVAIARALASGARILLADEPTGNLDVANGRRVMEILGKLAHDEGYCVVVVTHNLAIADAADRVWSMSDGALLERRPGRSLRT
ncbi:MAG: ABC transporter ATP-binding protein [Bacillota bacterium]